MEARGCGPCRRRSCHDTPPAAPASLPLSSLQSACGCCCALQRAHPEACTPRIAPWYAAAQDVAPQRGHSGQPLSAAGSTPQVGAGMRRRRAPAWPCWHRTCSCGSRKRGRPGLAARLAACLQATAPLHRALQRSVGRAVGGMDRGPGATHGVQGLRVFQGSSGAVARQPPRAPPSAPACAVPPAAL